MEWKECVERPELRYRFMDNDIKLCAHCTINVTGTNKCFLLNYKNEEDIMNLIYCLDTFKHLSLYLPDNPEKFVIDIYDDAKEFLDGIKLGG